MNVSVILTGQRSEATGVPHSTSANVNYLADNLVFQNYIELDGTLQRVVGVLKKRVGDFETVPRRFTITPDGIEIGDPLTNVYGVLDGIPERTGTDTARSPRDRNQ